jgi:hypothetical protein
MPELEPQTKPSQNPVGQIIERYRERSRRLRRNAGITIGIIGVLLVSGIAIFLAAGEIARREDELASTKALLENTSRTLLHNQTMLSSDLIESEAKAGKITEAGIKDLKESTVHLEAVASLIKQMDERPPVMYPQQTYFLVSTVTTRVGIIVLLLFLVQILVPLYRYNMRLAAFYDARADAITLVENRPSEQLETLVSLLSAEAIDFGKSPVPPREKALKLVRI